MDSGTSLILTERDLRDMQRTTDDGGVADELTKIRAERDTLAAQLAAAREKIIGTREFKREASTAKTKKEAAKSRSKTWTPLRAKVRANAGQIAESRGYTSLVQIASQMAGHIGPHCEPASPGCANCYSEANNGRCLPANGTGLPFDRRSRDLVETFLDEKILRQPLSWREPCNVFVCSQTDLFGEWVTDQQIDSVFAVMAWAHRHTFQILTKRAGRLREYSQGMAALSPKQRSQRLGASISGFVVHLKDCCNLEWPIANIWAGVSVESEDYLHRVVDLHATPATKRFISYEPALGPIDWDYPDSLYPNGPRMCCGGFDCGCQGKPVDPPLIHGIDWLIIGGESGPGARPFNIEWARNTIRQCRVAGVAPFLKQVGARPFDVPRYRQVTSWPLDVNWKTATTPHLSDRKGGDMTEWPEDVRVREFPR